MLDVLCSDKKKVVLKHASSGAVFRLCEAVSLGFGSQFDLIKTLLTLITRWLLIISIETSHTVCSLWGFFSTLSPILETLQIVASIKSLLCVAEWCLHSIDTPQFI